MTTKDKGIAYALLIGGGVSGLHKFYLGRTGVGVLYLFTLSFLGIGWLIDIFTLGKQVDDVNAHLVDVEVPQLKDKETAYLFLVAGGVLGLHKFYLGQIGIGMLYLFTCSFLGIGWLIDLCKLGEQVERHNARIQKEKEALRALSSME